MIPFLAQDTISTQKMKLLLFQVRRSSGEGGEHDELNIEGLVEELEHEGARYTWDIKVATGIKVTKVEVTGGDTKDEDATEVFWTEVEATGIEKTGNCLSLNNLRKSSPSWPGLETPFKPLAEGTEGEGSKTTFIPTS